MVYDNYLLINIILILGLIIAFIIGYKKGLVSQLLSLLSFFVANFIAWLLYKPFGSLFQVMPSYLNPFRNTILGDFFYLKMNSIVWYVLLFFIALIVIKLMQPVLELVAKAPLIRIFDRLLGAVIGLLIYGFMLFIALFIISTPFVENSEEIINQTGFRYVEELVDHGVDSIAGELERSQSLNILAFKPQQASQEDVIKVAEFLHEQGVLESKINEFIKEIEMKNDE